MRGSDPAAQLLRALMRHAGDRPVAFDHVGETPWASATFVGAQHRVAATGAGLDDVWLAALDDAELPMRGCFAAGCAIERTAAGAMLTVLVLAA